MDHGAVKNLEQIQEQDESARMPRALSIALVGLGGACIAFAVLAMGGRKTATNEKRPDPLGDLVAAHKAASTTPAAPAAALTQLSAKDVTFPQILSDEAKPTTALAAVRTPTPAPAPSATVRGSAAAPDRLPVVQFNGGTPPIPHDDIAIAPPSTPSLPAQNVLEATPIVTRPRDPLTKTASDAAQIASPPPASSPSGHEGGYQLQVSSFKTQAEAEQFADQLRARGHKAYTEEARVTGRGVWWRVRVGPFTSQRAAIAYRVSFEQKEHVVPFIVTPKDRHESQE
jgi:cell division septation protein DedD